MTPKQFTKKRLKFFRTKAACARYFGVTFICVSMWEKGQRPIPRYAEVIFFLLEKLEQAERVSGGGDQYPVATSNLSVNVQ